MDLSSLTLAAASQAIAAGKLTPVDLVEAALRRIDQLEGKVRAWVSVDAAGARRAAEERTREIRAGRRRGPLDGIPMGVKDLFDVAGWPTVAGSRILQSAPKATADAPAVAQIRAAGAVILGKTVTTEFALFDPPPTRNPWNLDRTPGGSSSGSAAAVAAGMCTAALGSQTGGSIVRPAAFCGVCGLKPTFGQVSRRSVVPISPHLDHVGALACTAEDLALIYDALDAADPDDPWCSPERSLPADNDRTGGHPRLAIVEDFFLEESSDEVRRAYRDTAERLAAAGATIVRSRLPDPMPEVLLSHRRIIALEAAASHRQTFPAQRAKYGPKLAEFLDEGLAVSAVDYAAALDHQVAFRARLSKWLADFDAMLIPSVSTPAPGAETTGDPRFQALLSFSGHPVVSFPVGLAGDGLPVSMQVVGHWRGERALLGVAAWCQKQVPFTARPPIVDEIQPR